ncbi:GntR family transcriptional regulator [bacterium M00.F.Ca.ET.152.01.1.1]|nr:GntR family transcriptional regulator [bacterium M00.F.Ca.ET.152.01.1.1]
MSDPELAKNEKLDDSLTRWRVLEAIRWRLISGGYRPSEKIKLRPLAQELGTSVTPIREALLQLVAAGALIHSPQRSIVVPAANRETYSEVRGLRIILEPRIAAFATAEISLGQIEHLEDLARKLDRRDPDDVTEYKVDLVNFHFGLYSAANRPVTLKMIEGLWLQSGPYLNYIIPDYLPFTKAPQLRAVICRALRKRDAMAVAEAVEADLGNALTFLLERLQTE